MNKFKVKLPTNVTRKIGRTKLRLKKNAPGLMVLAGVAGVIASGIGIGVASVKLVDILDNMDEDLHTVEYYSDHPNELTEEYTKEDAKNDTRAIYIRTGAEVAKLYAVPVAVGCLSIASILTSHQMMKKRNVALAAAYAELGRSFKDYRDHVAERFGDKLDKELHYNIRAKEVEERIQLDDGTETVMTKTVDVINTDDYDSISVYAKFYDDGCLGWSKDPEANMLFLKRQQTYATERLEKQGHLFLNEVYDMLGIPRTATGQIVGWIYDENHPVGDNFVDFGIYNIAREANRNFVNGYERTILLDFNVDGDIIEKIGKA